MSSITERSEKSASQDCFCYNLSSGCQRKSGNLAVWLMSAQALLPIVPTYARGASSGAAITHAVNVRNQQHPVF